MGSAVIRLKYCRYGVNTYSISQSMKYSSGIQKICVSPMVIDGELQFVIQQKHLQFSVFLSFYKMVLEIE